MSYCAVLREDGSVKRVVTKNGTESKLFAKIAAHPLVKTNEQALEIFKNKFSDTLIGKVNEINEAHYKKVLSNYRQDKLGLSSDFAAGRITEAEYKKQKTKLNKTLGEAQKNLQIDKKKFDVEPRDAKWDRKTIDEMEVSSFSNEGDVRHTIETGTFGLLTAENPMAELVTDIENYDSNEEAKQWLIEKGYQPQAVFGKYGNSEKSFFVKDLTREHAQAFAKKFKQESVAHSEGLVYQDGTFHPRTGQEVGIEAADLFTVVKTQSGTEVKFQVQYDWDTKSAANGDSLSRVNKSLINLQKPNISLIFADNSALAQSDDARANRNEQDQIEQEAQDLQDLVNCLWG